MRFPKCGMCHNVPAKPLISLPQSDHSLCKSLEYSMSVVKLPTEHHLESLSLKGDCTGSCESIHDCWKLKHFSRFHV